MILQRMWVKAPHICTYTIWLKSPKTFLLTQNLYKEGELHESLGLPDKILRFNGLLC